MTIEVVYEYEMIIHFKDLEEGDVFLHEEYDDLFIKSDEDSDNDTISVSLNSGISAYFCDDDRVTPMKCKLVASKL